jgi:hypothetical protein
VTKTIKWPATVRELGQMAEQRGMKASELLGELLEKAGPIPRPPAGYVLADGRDERWYGQEIVKRRWIILPVWDAVTDRHSLEIWMSGHEHSAHGHLTPAEARRFAADLITAAGDTTGAAE